MGLNLTKPALAYDDQPPVDDQSPIIDPATGLPIKVKPRVSFFPNNASRDWQFAHDAAQAAQPAGFKESTFRPYEEAGAQQQVEKGRLENQQAQVNLAFTPLRYSQMGAELQNKRADTAWKSVHAAYLNGISEVKDIPTLQQEYSRASMEAIAQNMKPMDSPKVRAIAGAITNLQKNQRDPVAQRKAFADSNQEMFGDADERKNFVLYGHDPDAKQSNATEWSLRVAASKGDPDAKRALRSYLADQKSLSDERADARATAQKTKGQDAANAEQIAGQILDSAGGDPDKALKFFDQQSGKITDPDQQRLGPSIRKAIRARKQINKPVSPIDRIINGDIEGGLGDMQQPQP